MVRSCISNAQALLYVVCPSELRCSSGRGRANHRRTASLAATEIAGEATAMHYKFSCFSTHTHIQREMGLGVCVCVCVQKPLSRLFNYSIIINDITYLYNGITKCLCDPKCKKLSFSSPNQQSKY